MTLELSATLAARNVEIALTLGPAETIAVMGPNGAGKSSVVQMLAGLIKPDSGQATLSGRTLFSLSPGATWLPPHERGVGVLAQEPLLFPHLSVLDNVAFGPRSQGLSKNASRDAAQQWLREVDAAELAGRFPAQLSGGQAQRVALARALATAPELLLLDEPMASLDVNSAPFLRSLLKRVLAGRRAIIVTHSVLDALMLADRILVMDGGRLVEAGPTAAVLARPRSAFAASLAGLNVLPGILGGSTLLRSDGERVTGRRVGGLGSGNVGAAGLVGVPGRDGKPPGGAPGADSREDLGARAHGKAAPGDGSAPAPQALGGQEGLAAFPPSAVSVFLAPPQGSPRNCFKVRVSELEPRGDLIRIRAGLLAADISPAATAELGLVPGSEVFFVVKAAEVVLYPA